MSFQDGGKYIGTVAAGSDLIESSRGTCGYQVMIESDEGDTTFFIIWLTPKNRDRARRDFETLGVTEEQLTDERYIQHQLGLDLVGRRIKFGVVEEEYNNETRLKVAWIGKVGANGNGPKQMASFFKGDSKEIERKFVAIDDDIPF